MSTPTAAEYAAGLRQLADLIETNPDLPVPTHLKSLLVWSLPDADAMRAVGFAALRAGASVEKKYESDYLTLDIQLGPMTVQGFVWRQAVCQRVLVGTDTEIIDEPDPDAPLVTIPDPTVTKQVERTVERYEWKCA